MGQRRMLRGLAGLALALVASLGASWAYVRSQFGGCPVRSEFVTHDFGEIPWGRTARHVFRFTNVSRRDVKVARVVTSCGCTDVELSANRLAPRQVGELSVRFSPLGFTGRVEQSVAVWFERYARPLALQVRARADPLVTPSPDHIDLGPLSPRSTTTARVVLRNSSGRRVRFTPVQPSADWVQARLLPAPDRSNRDAVLEIVLTNPPVGSIRETVAVETSLKVRPRIEIPIQAWVGCKWMPSESEFFFGFVNRGEQVTRTVQIKGLEPGLIRRVRAECAGLPRPRPISIGRGRSTEVRLTLDLRGVKEGLLKGNVWIETSDPAQPIMRLPIVGVVQEPGARGNCCGGS